MTSVARFCEKFVEAGWLIALILVAVFLNPFSDQVFEPDKVALFRAIVVLMLAALLIRTLDSEVFDPSRTTEAGGVGRTLIEAMETLRETPIAILALVTLLIYLVSTIASISPRASWWGSYQRAQGTYTFIAYLGLFFAVLAVLRRAGQLRRLIAILLLTSLPIAVYAVLQHYGMSLLKFSEVGVETRVISTLGNAIFLGAYLAMVMPITVWRFGVAVGDWFRTRRTQAVIGGVLYGGLFLVQFAAIIFTQSRGPILGMLVELFLLVLLFAGLRRQRSLAVASVAVAVVGVVALLAINVPGLAPDALRNLPYLERFGDIAGSTELQARTLAWETVLEVAGTNPTRAVLGYGPETMKVVLTEFMPARLWVLQGGGEYGTFDRAHNAVFDALYAHGLLGVLAYLLLYGLVFYKSLRWLGFAETRRDAGILIGLLAGGTLLGLVVPWVWRGDLVLAGMGMPAGMMAGMVLYVLGRAVVAPAPESTAEDEMRGFLVAALLAAIVGHFVESQTGIGIVATRSYFWLYVALIILLGTGRIGELSPALFSNDAPANQSATPSRGRSKRGRRGRSRRRGSPIELSTEVLAPVAALALIVAVLLGALSYAFVHGYNLPGARGPAQVLIWITLFLAGVIVLLELDRFSADVSWLGWNALTYAVTALLWLTPFALYHRVNARTLDQLHAVYVVFVSWLMLTLVAVAVALYWPARSARPANRSRGVALYPLIALLALVWVWRADVTHVRADVYEKVGKTAMDGGLWEQAIPNLQRAVSLYPTRDSYYIYLGGAYVQQARFASEPAVKETWVERGVQAFQQGWALSPRESDHPRQLGLAYRVWADWAGDAGTRRQRLEQSLSYYQAAVERSPENPDLRLDLGEAYLALGMGEEASTQYQHAVEIGSPSHLARAYAGLGDAYLIQDQLDQAVEAYRQAMQVGRDRQEVLEARTTAVNSYPDDPQVRESLALAYAAAGRQEDALQELNAALDVASSAEQRAEVERLIEMIEGD